MLSDYSSVKICADVKTRAYNTSYYNQLARLSKLSQLTYRYLIGITLDFHKADMFGFTVSHLQ